ncbi:hypothetical protein BH09PSE1_BH09PSE1_04910 [soil metagenome]
MTTRLVHVRTPTYRRPEMLRRALEALQAQSHQDWICDVYDDDREQSGRAVCDAVADPRIRYRPNLDQKFASANIDQCFSADNPHDAEFFFVLEDDNLVLPELMRSNIEACDADGVEILLRNQWIEKLSGTEGAHWSDYGVLDGVLRDQVYDAETFRLVLLTDIGVSNGGLFWSRRARSVIEIGRPCNATAQEYMRTFGVMEPIRVAMEPLAVWAENGAQTTRDLGDKASYLKRELNLKRSVQRLQRLAWTWAGPERRAAYKITSGFLRDPEARKDGLAKALLAAPDIRSVRRLKLALRGLAILILGRPGPDFEAFVADCVRRRAETRA